MREVTLPPHHYPTASSDAPHFLTNLLPRPGEKKAKTGSPLRKAFSATPCSTFNVKIQSCSDKTIATASSRLLYIATASVTVAFCISSSSSSGGLLRLAGSSYFFLASSQLNCSRLVMKYLD